VKTRARLALIGVSVFALAVLDVRAQAAAPNVNNPTALEWVASSDHAAADGYTVELLNADKTVRQSIDAGKPVPAATTNIVRLAINVMPFPFGAGYTARVRTRAGTEVSAWTVSENTFARVVGAPGRTVMIGTAQSVSLTPDVLDLARLAIRPESPYHNAGTDGRDLGADIPAILAGLCGVESGKPCHAAQ
jgi:hypothetical protein